MRTTVTLDEHLLARAAEITGITDESTLIRMGLEALLARESAQRLSLLGGSDPTATSAPRTRGDDDPSHRGAVRICALRLTDAVGPDALQSVSAEVVTGFGNH